MKQLHTLVSAATNNAAYISRNEWNDDHAPGYGLRKRMVEDEMLNAGTGTGNLGRLNWVSNFTGSGGVQEPTAADSTINHIGGKELFTGTTSGNYTAMTNGSGLSTLATRIEDVNSFTWVVWMDTITSITSLCGFMTDASSKTQADSVHFKFDPSVSANWECYVRGASAGAAQDSGIAVVASNWYVLHARRSGATDWILKVNAGADKTFNSNLPAAALTFGMTVHTNTTANRFLSADYVCMVVDTQTARY